MPTTPSLSRRPALGLAAMVAIVVIAALGALAANLGLLSTAPSAAGKVGELDGSNVASLVSDASSPADQPAVGEPGVDQSGVGPAVDQDDDHGGDRNDSSGNDSRGKGSSGNDSSGNDSRGKGSTSTDRDDDD